MKSGGTSWAGQEKASRVSVWSWVLYDFSNTIFSVSILSFFFPLWLEAELEAGAGAVANGATAISALIIVATAPVLGALADLRQRRVPYLVALTLASVVLTAGLDLAGGVVVAVALFVAADVAYQSALVFYNALLPSVSVGRGAGRVSGYGTAAGYVSTMLALVVLTFFVTGAAGIKEALGPLGGWMETGDEPNSNAFLPTAVLYLLFSLPAFFLVPDRAVREPRPVGMVAAYRGVVSTLRNMRDYGGMGTFIVATFLYTDAANTAIANMALYGREVFGMGQGEIRNLLLFSAVFAVVGSAGSGYASDGAGPKKTLVGVLVIWIAAIGLASVALAPWMLMLSGPLVGVALGGTWTVSRVMLVALSPPEKLGEFFGLFSLAGKLSAVLGPAITAVLLWTFEDLLGGSAAYRIAIGSLALVMSIGLFFLLRVPDARPDPNVEAPAA